MRVVVAGRQRFDGSGRRAARTAARHGGAHPDADRRRPDRSHRRGPVVRQCHQRQHQRGIDRLDDASICTSKYWVLRAENDDNSSKRSSQNEPDKNEFVDEPVFVNNNISNSWNIFLVTSQGPATSFLFALKIVELLKGKEME